MVREEETREKETIEAIEVIEVIRSNIEFRERLGDVKVEKVENTDTDKSERVDNTDTDKSDINREKSDNNLSSEHQFEPVLSQDSNKTVVLRQMEDGKAGEGTAVNSDRCLKIDNGLPGNILLARNIQNC